MSRGTQKMCPVYKECERKLLLLSFSSLATSPSGLRHSRRSGWQSRRLTLEESPTFLASKTGKRDARHAGRWEVGSREKKAGKHFLNSVHEPTQVPDCHPQTGCAWNWHKETQKRLWEVNIYINQYSIPKLRPLWSTHREQTWNSIKKDLQTKLILNVARTCCWNLTLMTDSQNKKHF